MNASIILIAYHGDRWLPACISSLGTASTNTNHLVLVDNSGNTGIHQLDLSAFDAEIVKTPHPMGFAEANNYALVQARHLEETILFLNQDTVSSEGWIDQCLACFKEEASLGAVSPLITTYEGTGWDPSFIDCVGTLEALEHELAHTDAGCFHVQNAPAPALLVRTGVLRSTGPFDPVFGSYYEDYDLCRRIREAGYRIGFCRTARLAHYSGSTTTTKTKELKRMRQIIRNRLLYRLREAEGRRRQVLLQHVFVDLPRRLVRGVLHTPSSQPPLVTLKAHADLARLGLRLMSQEQDEADWRAYLSELGWPDHVPGFKDVENEVLA